MSRCLLGIPLSCALWTGSVLFGSIHPGKLTSPEKAARTQTLLQLSSTLIASKTLYTWQLIFLQHHFHKAFICVCVCFKNQISLWFLKVITCTLSDYVENNIGLGPNRRQRILNYFDRVIRIKTLLKIELMVLSPFIIYSQSDINSISIVYLLSLHRSPVARDCLNVTSEQALGFSR